MSRISGTDEKQPIDISSDVAVKATTKSASSLGSATASEADFEEEFDTPHHSTSPLSQFLGDMFAETLSMTRAVAVVDDQHKGYNLKRPAGSTGRSRRPNAKRGPQPRSRAPGAPPHQGRWDSAPIGSKSDVAIRPAQRTAEPPSRWDSTPAPRKGITAARSPLPLPNAIGEAGGASPETSDSTTTPRMPQRRSERMVSHNDD